MMSCTTDAPVINAEDKFRQVDKSIKALLKTLLNDKPTKKRSWVESTELANSDKEYPVEDIISVCGTSSSSKMRLIRSLAGCCCSEPHPCTNEMKIYELNGYPSGLYMISQGLCKEAQYIWAKRALEEYSQVEHTNLTNLHPTEDHSHIWDESRREKDFAGFKKLRWSCLGYHYDWTHRMYQKNLKSDFPAELSSLCQHIVSQVQASPLVPEAAIVNYYPLGTSMGGHLDDAEHTLCHPIVSISLGCAAVFLIGGRTKDVSPHALLVQSGDMVVMAGESRLCYHGVPVIVPGGVEEKIVGRSRVKQYTEETADMEKDSECEVIWRYLRSNRINMNVRQVRVDADKEGQEGWVDKTGTGYVKYAT